MPRLIEVADSRRSLPGGVPMQPVASTSLRQRQPRHQFVLEDPDRTGRGGANAAFCSPLAFLMRRPSVRKCSSCVGGIAWRLVVWMKMMIPRVGDSAARWGLEGAVAWEGAWAVERLHNRLTSGSSSPKGVRSPLCRGKFLAVLGVIQMVYSSSQGLWPLSPFSIFRCGVSKGRQFPG